MSAAPSVSSAGRPGRSLSERRAERELFFWTIRQILLSVLLAAATVYVIVSMLRGEAIPFEPVLRSVAAL